MRKLVFTGVIVICMIGKSYAQIGINSDNSAPAQSAMIDIKSSGKGLLIPRMTQAQIQTIVNPVNSLLVFCTTDDKFYAYIAASGQWKEVAFGTGTLTPTCGLPVTDARDGKTYNTVQIGTQCWMSQNMNLGTRINGSQNQTNNSTFEKYCYANVESNCDIYGGLYQWGEAMQYSSTPGTQGICPTGWHLPTDAELTTLITYLGGPDVAGGKVKEAGTTHWQAPNTGATDESGFTILPGSYRDYLGAFSGALGTRTSIWSSTVNGGYAWDYTFYFNTDDAEHNGGAMHSNGFSIRCIKN